MLCLTGTALFLFSAEKWLLWQKSIAAVLLIFSVLSIGWLLERKAFAFKLEAGRLLVLGTAWVIFSQLVLQQQVLAFVSALLLISMYVWLLKVKRVIGLLSAPLRQQTVKV
jgi:hypothetical protein